MQDNFNPRYEALPVEDGGGWRVVITSSRGPAQELFGFVTESQARAWIGNEICARAARNPSPVKKTARFRQRPIQEAVPKKSIGKTVFADAGNLGVTPEI